MNPPTPVGASRYVVKKAVLGRVPEMEIAEDRYRLLAEARNGLAEILAMEEKFDLVLANYIEFELSVIECSLDMVVYNVIDWGQWASRLNVVNRRLLNLLSSGRLLLDQLRHHSSSLFGSASPERCAIESLIEIAKLESVGFRAVEALRNYVQHRGLPVALLTHQYWTDNMRDGETSRKTGTVAPQLSIAKLTEDPKFSKPILAELKQIHSETVDLKPLVREWVEWLRALQEGGREMVDEVGSRWDRCVESVFEEYTKAFGDDVLGLAAMKLSEHGILQGDRVSLGTAIIERRRELRSKNSVRRSLAKLSVTTASR
jgi:hypothetical protein